MSKTIRINGFNLNEYLTQYRALSIFSYDNSQNKLVFEGEVLPVSDLVIDEIFLMMDINDLRTFIKDGFYQKSSDIFNIEKMTEKLLLTEDDFEFLEKFVKKSNDRFYLYTKYKNILEKNVDSISIRTFLQDTIISKKFINRSYELANPNEKDVYSIVAALDTANQKVNEEESKKENIGSGKNEEKGFSLVKQKNNNPVSQWNFNEEEYISQANKVGAAGFTSIIAVVTVAILFGVYLAIISLG